MAGMKDDILIKMVDTHSNSPQHRDWQSRPHASQSVGPQPSPPEVFISLTNHTARETLGKDWDYFQLSPQANVCMRPRQDLSDSTFEPVLIVSLSFSKATCILRELQDSLKQSPNAVNEIVEGRSAYASNDLLVQHPTRPDLWKVYGRADDQIMLSTGEHDFLFIPI
jgi:hypothetical protein